jgi:hypothetical protein
MANLWQCSYFFAIERAIVKAHGVMRSQQKVAEGGSLRHGNAALGGMI